MTQYATRRELREAERRGIIPQVSAAPEPAAPQVVSLPNVDLKNLTRRQMKEMGIFDNPEKVLSAPAVPISEPSTPKLEVVSQPLPLPVPDIEFPKTDFNEQNFLAEPTTASIVLERAPEAIVLPIDTGEIAITNSIQVVTDPIASATTGNFDGVELDQIILSDDAVTGVISVVEPISALDLIDQRAASGVVPSSVLSRGWWKPWAIGIGAILMTVAAVLAIFFMLNAVGSN
ncbi:MAG: hypothetical protein RL537_777 [Actinomycetota bacterium]